ncbi:MAG TPA: HAMP domain-containing sensor histidine kinase [Acidothermaceae bacterium]
MRRRLLILAAATTTLVIVAFLVPLSVLVRNLAHQRALNDGLKESQRVVNAVQTIERTPAAIGEAVKGSPAGIVVSVRLGNGQWVGGLPPDPDSPARQFAVGPNGTELREVQVRYKGGLEIWHPVTDAPGKPIVIRTFVSASLFNKGVFSAIVILVLVGIAILAVAMIIADQLARWTVRPVAALASTANRLSSGQMLARAPVTGPREVVEVGIAMNRLAKRINELLDDEREQVADLSHRLRTPVAAVKLAVEALPESPEATRLTEHVDALERTVGSVIREARRGVREQPAPACDVVSVVKERVAFWAVLAEDQGRRVELRLPTVSRFVRVSADDLAAAIDALLENVFAHTAEGTAMAVAVELDRVDAWITVSDEGPGIGPDSVDRGRSAGGSTGLGLDIVRRTAQGSGGSFGVGASPTGGAAMMMRLGPAD